MAVAPAQRIRDLADLAVARSGLVVEDVRLIPAGRRTVVRVTVDLPQDALGGVPVDAVALAAGDISRALDEHEVLGASPYVLEVSSPGVDRPLSERRHWMRARGRLVTVTAGGSKVTGRLQAVGDEGVRVDDRDLPWAGLGKGRVEVEFRRDEAAPDDVDELDEPEVLDVGNDTLGEETR